MALGRISGKSLTGIANAIRKQNGTDTRYRPGEMASAVLALDGTNAGETVTYDSQYDSGLVDSAVLASIADSIRSQNGSESTYTPAEMADAILALEWDLGVKLRALLLDDGTLEFNYRDGRSSTSGRPIVAAWEVDPNGHASADRPWDDRKLEVVDALFAADIAGAGMTSTASYFNGCTNLKSVPGLENPIGTIDMSGLFIGCDSFKSVYSRGFSATVTGTGTFFYGCKRLVDGEGYVPKNTDPAAAFSFGEKGALTDPDSDARVWVYAALYDDGQLAIKADDSIDEGREVIAKGRICANALYNAVGATPWYEQRAKLTAALLDASLKSLPRINLNY